MSDPVGLDASVIWWALVVGLVVQGLVIYVAVRFALFHHRLMVQEQDKAAARLPRAT